MNHSQQKHQAPPLRVHLRHMIRRDLPEVLAIEQAAFVFPWLEEDLSRALLSNRFVLMVAETTDQWIAGYSIVERRKHSRELLKIATLAGARRYGVGRRLLRREIEKQYAPQPLTAVVHEANLGGQLFFAACDFRCVGILRRWFDGPQEDGYEFAYRGGQVEPHYPLNRLTQFGARGMGGAW